MKTSQSDCQCTWDDTHQYIVYKDPICLVHNPVISVKSMDATPDPGTETFSSGATRSKHPELQKHHLVAEHGQRRLACRFGLGDTNYPPYNWRKGIPFGNLLDHLEEHLLRLRTKLRENKSYRPDLDDDEAAIAWAVFAIMQFQCEGRSDELNDVYWNKDKEERTDAS